MEAARGDAGAAGRHRAEAVAVFRALRVPYWAERAEEEARGAGSTP